EKPGISSGNRSRRCGPVLINSVISSRTRAVTLETVVSIKNITGFEGTTVETMPCGPPRRGSRTGLKSGLNKHVRLDLRRKWLDAQRRVFRRRSQTICHRDPIVSNVCKGNIRDL